MLLTVHVIKRARTPLSVQSLMHKNLHLIFINKMRPYTKKSNYVPARIPSPSLGAGAPAAHRVNRLMLLGSPPDMVHGSQLRGTRSSTRLLRFCAKAAPSDEGSTPAVADFRYRAPLIPRLVWPYFTAYRISITHFCRFCNSENDFSLKK